ncbi:Hin recombinase [Streptomyces sp. NPDC059340]|uniref:Hin recombinase n=1 Tax=Streptomyces sp. NPDC059340 TaxID=3346806 RepID=UPI00367EE205
MAIQKPGDPQPPPFHKPPKLTPAQRDEIRRRIADGDAVLGLAAEFGVSVRTIRQNS